ncbi:MAG: manganese ABC transporter ATP-binding protein [Flavobacteriales bacterium]|nr:manganese ABC transporter ATP-binding protein [Flavobacteriales bacterium]|tara:strand:- start:5696 stop:6484 length:789 start_codon:yes stop_codon:yes gene_type:complete
MIKHVDHPIVEVHDLTVAYDNKPVLWNADFSIPKGKMIGIVGPNGAGKSTLLKSVMGLIPPASGFVKIYNKNLEDVRSKVAYVPQKESVDWDFPANVLDVVEMGRYGKKNLFKRLTKSDKNIAVDALKKVKMLEFSERHISELSGGQQQRVFIARALAQEADIYFMDEPFSGVDMASEKTIVDLLMKLKKEGKTIFVVHHDLQSAMDYFDWMILINRRIVASGPISEVFNSELLQKTYGGNLSLLDQIGQVFKEKQFPIRED